MNSPRTIWKESILIVLFLGALSGLFYKQTLTQYPSHVHAWSQSDRFAIAEGFLRNGMDFFHPETWVLNGQFEADSLPGANSAITSVDFPIHDYIPAIGMKLNGGASSLIFRLYILLYSLLGLIFLYFSILEMGLRRIAGLMLIGFVFTAPVFTYYQAGFIPTIPSIANIFIGIWCLNRYFRLQNGKYFILGVGFFTLAALARTPFVIFLIAFAGTVFLAQVFSRKFDWKQWLIIGCGFLFIGGYFLYNQSLRAEYGSIFLGSPLTPDSVSTAVAQLSSGIQKWGTQYFSWWHLGWLMLLPIMGLINQGMRKNPSALAVPKRPFPSWLPIWLGISTIGVVLYSLLMSQQFDAHDYYFLDTFFILLVVGAVWGLWYLGNLGGWMYWVFTGLSAIALVLMMTSSLQIQESRYSRNDWNRTAQTYQNFLGAGAYLDSLGISGEAKILVLGAYAPNIPLSLMHRYGYAYLSTRPENVHAALQKPFDIAVMQDAFLLSDVVTGYPAIVDSLRRIGGNGRISVYERARARSKNGDILSFTGLANRKVFFRDSIDFDSRKTRQFWYSTTIVPEPGNPADNHIAFMDSTAGFALSLTLIKRQLPSDTTFTVMWSGRAKAPAIPKKSFFVVSVLHEGKTPHFYQRFSLETLLPYPNTWERILFQVPVHAPLHPRDEIKIQIWNPGKNIVYFDDVSVALFSAEDAPTHNHQTDAE